MKRSFGFLAPLVTVLGAVLAAGCGDSSAPATAQGGGAGSSGGSGPTSTAALVYGCDWLIESTAENDNFAFPETNAVYWLAALPDHVGPKDTIEIAGTSASARYFSFAVYDENGKIESQLDDSDIVGQSATPAALVPSGQSYTVSVVYSATAKAAGTTLVANPLQNNLRQPRHKFLLYRLYLPTSGADGRGNLPALTYVSSTGIRTPLAQTPDQASCNTIYNNVAAFYASGGGTKGTGSLILIGSAVKPPQMTIYRSSSGVFENMDVRYMNVKTNTSLGELFLIRGQAPGFGGGASTPQVRYWSICSDELRSTEVVQCLADRDATLDADGYYNVIIATTAPSGYGTAFEYLPWGTQPFGRPIYRQLLADPGFKQSIDNSSSAVDPKTAMGTYYPQTTYCSRSVFSANLAAGTAAVFKACQSSEGVGSVPDL
ncbi:MAG: hypothetical protein P4L83_02020 [Nevskia sp.]|nr:hypothetical protein [Nevskia sp.]